MILAELVATVFAHAVHSAVIASEEAVLKAERKLRNVHFSKRFYKNRAVAVDVVPRAQLAGVVVAPRQHIVACIKGRHKPAAQL